MGPVRVVPSVGTDLHDSPRMANAQIFDVIVRPVRTDDLIHDGSWRVSLAVMVQIAPVSHISVDHFHAD